jgi:hypothetical protein
MIQQEYLHNIRIGMIYKFSIANLPWKDTPIFITQEAVNAGDRGSYP